SGSNAGAIVVAGGGTLYSAGAIANSGAITASAAGMIVCAGDTISNASTGIVMVARNGELNLRGARIVGAGSSGGNGTIISAGTIVATGAASAMYFESLTNQAGGVIDGAGAGALSVAG